VFQVHFAMLIGIIKKKVITGTADVKKEALKVL
jgi:hypothetical protein